MDACLRAYCHGRSQRSRPESRAGPCQGLSKLVYRPTLALAPRGCRPERKPPWRQQPRGDEATRWARLEGRAPLGTPDRRGRSVSDSGENRTRSRIRPSKYWMRSVSFAGLHRILRLVAESPLAALRASEIDSMVRERGMVNTIRGTGPARTTVYHYRNTLLQLRVLRRAGRTLRINREDADVRALVHIPCAEPSSRQLPAAAQDHFASLLLRNHQCRSLFFDLFMPIGGKGLFTAQISSGSHTSNLAALRRKRGAKDCF